MLIAAALAFGWFVYSAFSTAEPGLRVEPTTFTIEPAPVEGTDTTVRFRMVNDSAYPVRVVGLSTC